MSSSILCPNPNCAKPVTVAPGAAPPKCPACRTLIAPIGTQTGSRPAARATVTDPAERYGRFVVLGKLGAGAFGTVFRARDPQLDREVALKVPNPGVLADPKRVERFLREAKAAARLRHPNIVPVFDAGTDAGRHYIAAAFVDGTQLADQIPDRGMDLRRAAEIVRQLAGAVGYAHEQGIVHRDIKPANVMLDRHDHPHLMDFGLAARADEAEKLTNDGAVMGTPAYMSPEQAGGQRADPTPAWDQYALGVVLYELLTGRTPFSGPPAAVIFRVLNSDPPPPREVRPAVPRDLETICLKAMARDPDDRYADCAALADDLRRWLAGEPIRARSRGLGERAVAWVRANDTVTALASVAFGAMALGTILAVTFAEKANKRAGEAEQAQKDRKDEATRHETTTKLAEQRGTVVDDLRLRLTTTEARLGRTTADLTKTGTDLAAARAEAASTGGALAAELAGHDKTRKALVAAEEEVRTLGAEVARLGGELGDAKRELGARAVLDARALDRKHPIARDALVGNWSQTAQGGNGDSRFDQLIALNLGADGKYSGVGLNPGGIPPIGMTSQGLWQLNVAGRKLTLADDAGKDVAHGIVLLAEMDRLVVYVDGGLTIYQRNAGAGFIRKK